MSSEGFWLNALSVVSFTYHMDGYITRSMESVACSTGVANRTGAAYLNRLDHCHMERPRAPSKIELSNAPGSRGSDPPGPCSIRSGYLKEKSQMLSVSVTRVYKQASSIRES